MNIGEIIMPDWPAPGRVKSLSTTRRGGVSSGPWDSFNLGDRCGDKPEDVMENRRRLASMLPSDPHWMRQVHGTGVTEITGARTQTVEADAAVTSVPGQVLAILSADCLAVLLCDARGTRIGAAHAGWRGLAGGVIQAAVGQMQRSPDQLMAWLGPCIGPDAYEVGNDVRQAFESKADWFGSDLPELIRPAGGRWKLDLAGAARALLENLGISRVYGGGFCTYRDSGSFYSYRRDGITGRMASLIWLEEK